MAFRKSKRNEHNDSVKKRRDLNLALELWPIAIWQSRYGGVYEGGRWIAIGNCEILPQHTAMMDQDTECMDFWKSKQADHIGRGATPDEALEDLLRRNQDLNQIVNSFYAVDWDRLIHEDHNEIGKPKKIFWKRRPFR